MHFYYSFVARLFSCTRKIMPNDDKNQIKYSAMCPSDNVVSRLSVHCYIMILMFTNSFQIEEI